MHRPLPSGKIFVTAGIAALCAILPYSLLAQGRTPDSPDNFSEYSFQIIGSEESVDMVPVEGGTFMMGSPKSEQGRSEDEGPRQKVTVDSFWMSKYEMTWEEYDLFANEVIDRLKEELAGSEENLNISADAISTPTPPYVDMSFGMGKENRPAINITHYAAVMFTKWLSAKTGHFFRLPTEAEWEYACRAGSRSAYHYGDDPAKLNLYAWYEENSDDQYHPVGSKKPNAFGLHDMLGNVAEWTMDQYYENYFEKLEDDADNPWFKPTVLYPRTVRGGSWQGGPESQRCANRRGSRDRWKVRDPQIPKSRWWLTNAPFVGFRVIRPKTPPSREQMEEYWLDPIEDY